MFKVIVERPRKGKFVDAKFARLRDSLDGPTFMGIRAGYGYRALNENLNPLQRYLHKQVGRPWSKVSSEIATNIDRRNTVQQHVFQHIDDFVATDVAWREGRWVDLKEGCRPLGESRKWRQALLVDPRTGLIRRNEQLRSALRQRRAKWAALDAARESRRRVLAPLHWLMSLDGHWYEVRLASLPPVEIVEDVVQGRLRQRRRAPWVFDAILKQKVRREHYEHTTQREYFYGKYATIYAVSKRQLSRREIARHGLPG